MKKGDDAFNGTGLGLCTVYGIVRQSGGYISVDSELGRGTTVEIHLARVADAVAAVRPRAETGPLPVGNEVILLAEDEERVRSLAATVLEQQGYKVIEACDGQQAVEIAERCAGEIQASPSVSLALHGFDRIGAC